MLRCIMRLYGKRLRAFDGDIGHVKDFYFNDQQWVIRYIIADTGSWLPGRFVLISPYAFGNFHQDGDCLLVNLTRQQIQNSPKIESHKPVSRQYEEAYNRYYDLPSYWVGGEVWGLSALPWADLGPSKHANSGRHLHIGGDPHLRSTEALTGSHFFNGYHIQTSEGAIGHVTDFIMDDKSWAIRHLVVETGHLFSRRKIAISPQHVDYVSYEEHAVFVSLTKEAILEAPEYQFIWASSSQLPG